MSSYPSPSLFLKSHYRIIWWFIAFLSLLPALSLLIQFKEDDLGINPLETLTHSSGQWSLIFLIITLSVTPLRRLMAWYSKKVRAQYGKRLSDWNWIIRLRRLLGLNCFFYASLHFWIFLNYDLDWQWQFLWSDIEQKNYILVGMISYVLLTLLALTSFNQTIRWLKGYWKKIHQLIYLIAILVIIHFWMLVKVGVNDPLYYSLILFTLLAYRLIAHYGWLFSKPRDQGEVVPERD